MSAIKIIKVQNFEKGVGKYELIVSLQFDIFDWEKMKEVVQFFVVVWVWGERIKGLRTTKSSLGKD